MHDGWLLLLDVLGVLLVLVLIAGVWLVVRRRVIARDGGTFELSHRSRVDRDGRGWVLGVGRYSGERLEWFRFFSLSPRPHRIWLRDDVDFVGRRDRVGAEDVSLYDDHVVVRCGSADGEVEFAMSESSLMGLQAWLEAGPPRADWDSRPVR
ncbi:DUF2550 domain-containing protein [Nocardioides yefusunii]|uniref:DUF2550 domain-containing protein n=1 Tax=Nocardioides yefusunii TaxID=2500546 RepID=A0ABW1QXR8_9ACTN|nr:DUF2550 domain-containing protein [Nocardioides yefusunii]